MQLTCEEYLRRKHLLEDLNVKVANLLGRHKLKIKSNVEANMTASFGNCLQSTDFSGNIVVGAEIHVSKYITSDECLINTMLHELCHAYAPMRAKHGPEWQKIAKQVGDAFGVKISRLATAEESRELSTAVPKKKVVAKLVCQKCGNVIEITNRGKIYQRRGIGYACTCKTELGKRCGGHFDFIDLDN